MQLSARPSRDSICKTKERKAQRSFAPLMVRLVTPRLMLRPNLSSRCDTTGISRGKRQREKRRREERRDIAGDGQQSPKSTGHEGHIRESARAGI